MTPDPAAPPAAPPGPEPAPRLGYLGLLRTRHAARLMSGTLVGRLPVGMATLAVLLFVRAHHGSYALAGLLTAAYGIGQAIGQPLLGRAVDLRGQPAVMTGAALLSAAGFTLLATVGLHPAPLAAAAVVLAGLCTPPLEAGLRALWPSVLARREHVQAAYAIDAAAQELMFVAGPLLVVACTHALSEAWALVVTGLLGLAGTLVVVTSRPSRSWRGAPRTSDWLGPLRAPGLLALFGSFFFVGIALSAINVAAVAYADRLHDENASGILLAGLAGGALIGGLVHGARSWPGAVENRLRLLTAALAVCYLPPALTPSLLPMTLLTVLAGVFLAPAIACAFVVVDRHAPTGTVTEAFSWLVTAFGVGGAAGSALAGPVTGAWGDGAGFLVPGAAGLAALAVQLLAKHRLSAAPEPAAG